MKPLTQTRQYLLRYVHAFLHHLLLLIILALPGTNAVATHIDPLPNGEVMLEVTWNWKLNEPYIDPITEKYTDCGYHEYLLFPEMGEGTYTLYAYQDGALIDKRDATNRVYDVLEDQSQDANLNPITILIDDQEGYDYLRFDHAHLNCSPTIDAYLADLQATRSAITYHLYFKPAGPNIDFVIVPSEKTPGEFMFKATSVDSLGRNISHEWIFDDGSTVMGNSASHTYSKIGTFPVTLKGTVLGEEPAIKTKNVSVEATKLTTDFRFTDTRSVGIVPSDKDFSITLDIKTNNGVGGIDQASVTASFGNALNLEIVSAPNIPATFRLSPNETRSYEWVMRPLSGGRWRIAGTVAGTDIGNNAVEAFDALEGAVNGNELTAEITLTPDSIETQEEDLNGDPVPIEFRADLSICNNTSEPISNVNLQQFRAIPAFEQSFYVTQLSGPDIDTVSGLDIGTLAASTCVSYNATFLAKDDNEIEVDARVTGVSPVGATLSGTDEAFLSIGPKYLLEVTTKILRPRADETLLPAGDTIRIGGKVKNLSNTHKILLGPLYPELSGNAGAQSLSWNNSGTDPDAFEVPEYPQYLEPGEEKEFTVRITTLASDPRHGGDPKPHGGTRANITFTPWGIATNPKGEQTVIKEDRIKSDASDLQLTISIDDSIPVPETDYLALAGGVMIGSVEAAGAMAAGLVLGAIEAVKLPYTVIAGASTYQSRVWSSFTEEEKNAFANNVGFLAASVLLRNYDMAQQDFASLWDSANQAVLNSMTEMADEWELGNHSDVARVYAKYGGEAIGEVALPFAMAKLAKSAEAANALKRTQAALNAEMAPLLSRVDDVVSVERVSDILFTVKNGTEADLNTLRKVMGYTEEEVGELQRIAKKYGILLTSRSRQAISIRWVQKFLAKLKPEKLKIKSVSPLDELLGYPAIYRGESSVGALVFKKPDVLVIWEQKGGAFEDIVSTFLKDKGIRPNEPLWEEAVNRISLRVEEWNKYEKTYKQWDERGWIDTTFTNEFNAISNETWLQVNPKFATQGAGKFEGFRLRKIHADGSPNEAYIVELFDGKAGKWRPVTGDIDNIAFTRTDGTALDELTHAQITKEISNSPILGARHGESATAKPGVGGLDFIQSQFDPGEAAIQFSPTGEAPRFVRLDTETGKSYWNNPRDYRLEWKGGFSDTGDTLGATGSYPTTPLPPAPKVPEPAAISKAMPIPAPLADGSPNVGRCSLEYSSASDAPAVIMGDEGKLLNIDVNGATSTSSLHDTCFSEGEVIVVPITPVTTIFKQAKAGDQRVEVYDDGSVASDGGAGGFEGGQSVFIGAGTGNAEIRTIIDFGSLVFDRALAFDHEPGEIIVVIEAPLEAADTDGDGVIDREDELPGDPSDTLDSDNDGIGNNTDTDDDNDGISDVDEIKYNSDPLDPTDKPEHHRPDTPQINSVQLDDADLQLDLSPFSDPDETGTTAASIEAFITGMIADDPNAVIFSGPVLKANPLTLPQSLLDANAVYFISVRYIDASGLSSGYSSPQMFVTADFDLLDENGNGIDDTIEHAEAVDLNGNSVIDTDEGIVVISDAINKTAIAIRADAGTITRVNTLDGNTLPSPSLSDFPVGLIDFRLDKLDQGQGVDMAFYFEKTLENNSMRWLQYDANREEDVGIIDLSEQANFQESIIAVRYVDGGIGDLDGVANGRIIGTSGPGTADCLFVGASSCNDSLLNSGSDSRCFIATALYGENGRLTNALRAFRDKYLLNTQPGQDFLEWYYENSPVWVAWTEDKPLLRDALKFLLTPVAEFAALLSGADARTPWSHILLITLLLMLTRRAICRPKHDA